MPHQELYNRFFSEHTGYNPKESLQSITGEYPYFSIAHFFLLKETGTTDFNYKKIAAKTALHFNNPFLLNYQLNRKLKTEKPAEIVEVADKGEKVDAVEGVNKVDTVEKVEAVEEVNKVDAGEKVEAVEEVNKVDTVEKVEAVEKAGKKEELLFEPLHTTDYFASQGIKLSEEAQPGDKLGKQLKSFTDWLKTMKKVHQGKLPEGNAGIDLAVQNLAEKSNKEPEILTEAMAEVFVQQGKAEKANEIYKKLSLLNPDKSAYFAAKIELLKEN